MPCNHYSLTLVTGPASEPVDVPTLKANARVSGTSQDDLFTEWGKAAREQLEADSDCKFMPQTWLLTLDSFPGYVRDGRIESSGSFDPIHVPIFPFTGVSSIKYDDRNDTEQTLSPSLYYVKLNDRPGKIFTIPTVAWPATSLRMGAVRITVTAGYANAAAVPARAKQAIRMLVAHWNQNRELATDRNTKGVEMAYDAACQSLRPGFL